MEIVRRAYAALSAGDAKGIREVLPEEFFADFSRRQVDPWALPRDAALEAFLSQIGEAWERPPAWEPVEVLDAEDKIAVLVHTSARGRGSGVEVDARIWNVWTFRDGRPINVTYIGEDREAALEAAQLSA